MRAVIPRSADERQVNQEAFDLYERIVAAVVAGVCGVSELEAIVDVDGHLWEAADSLSGYHEKVRFLEWRKGRGGLESWKRLARREKM